MPTDPLPALRLSALGHRAQAPAITALMQVALETPGLLSLAAGFTDNQTLPVAAIFAGLQNLAAADPSRAFLQYGANAGRPGLRSALARRLHRLDHPGSPADAPAPTQLVAQTFITNGSQQALYLAIQTLCEPGDIVLVDRPSYFVFLELLKGLGVEARTFPTRPDGTVDAAALRTRLRLWRDTGERLRLKAVYFVSWFSNPTGHTLGADAKNELAAILRAEDCVVPVIEDAAYRELGYAPASAAAQPGILAAPAWDGFPRLYTGTLTKPFATGLKVGFGVCDHPAWLAAMLHVKGHHDFGTAHLNQALLEQVLTDGSYDAQLAVLRKTYAEKGRALDAALRAGGLPELGWSWNVPEGGIYLWLHGPAALPTGLASAFCKRCLAEGVLYVPGELCFGDAPETNTVRLSFGVLSPADLREAAARFCRAATAFA